MSTAEFIFRGYPTHGDAISLKSIDIQVPSNRAMASLQLTSATGGQIRARVEFIDPIEPVGVLKAYVREASSSFAMKLAYTGTTPWIVYAFPRFNITILNLFR